MNRSELITAMASKSGLSKKDAEKALQVFMEVTTDALTKGDKIALSGFGTFEVVERAPREARNPKTGEKIVLGATKSPKFKPSKVLKDAVKT